MTAIRKKTPSHIAGRKQLKRYDSKMFLKVLRFIRRKRYFCSIIFSFGFLIGTTILYSTTLIEEVGFILGRYKHVNNGIRREISPKWSNVHLQRKYKLFDAGAQFDTSFSPLYKSSVRSTVEVMLEGLFESKRLVSNADCRLLFENNFKEIKRVRGINVSYEMQSYCQQTKDCENFISKRGYIMDPLTDEERKFPISYSILVYQSPEQFELLLRAIYRPQNVYCVHVDNKTANYFFNEFTCIAKCFSNVFLASERINVNWGTMSVLSADLVCMRNLLSYTKWKFFINLTGQEFPLRTNYELVKILQAFNGSNDGEGTILRANKDRWQIPDKPPHNITPVKGSVHVTLNRKFVEYVITGRVAADFLKWVNNTNIPDETFFATLIHNPHLGIPGSFKGDLETDFGIRKPFLSRFKNWKGALNSWPCHGKHVRSICVFGVGDIALLARRPEFFANKFHFDYQRHALLCMDQLIYNRTRDEYLHQLKFDTDYYENLEHMKNIV